ncbi:hypothetical protein BGZ74_006060 [Mortierella antarctica]|nr:hypothetical protein BGZ74_006060 [Mortierella antarctica]
MRRVPEGIKEVALASSSRIAPSFMEQLGYQTRLYDLVLPFNAAYRCGASPFLQLAIGLLNGLDQFEELKRLEYFSCTGILHEVGSSEIAWMKVHWPRLRKIHLPVFDAEDKTELEWNSFGSMVLPDYQSYFLSWEVVKILGWHYAC